jgi:hypothetical protein
MEAGMRGKITIVAVALLVAATLHAGTVQSCWQGNVCQPWNDTVFGPCPVGWTPNTNPCPAASPTPAPTVAPTATATPTPAPQLPYTVQPVLAASALGYSYLQAPTMIDKSTWGNGGVCCKSPGETAGECEWVIDNNPPIPTYREWWCTYRDSSELYESLGPQVAHSDRYKWVVAMMVNRRPPVGALQSEAAASILVGFGLQSLSEQFRWPERVGRLFPQEDRGLWPLGILDLRGVRWLYCLVLENFYGRFELWRFAWPDAYSPALWSTTTKLAVLTDPLSEIAIDKDGSLVSTIDTTPAKFARGSKLAGKLKWWPTADSTLVKVVRSTDEGRTWADAGISFAAPAGKFLSGCGWEHTSGGGAVVPWHLLCIMSSGKGPDAVPSDWNLADIRVNGAKVPANWGVTPVLVKP